MEVIRALCLLLWAALWASPSALAAEKEIADTGDYYYRRFTPAPIASITVTRPRYVTEGSKTEKCQNFKATPKTIKFFFRHAEFVSRSEHFHYGVESGCYSEGTVTYANGIRGEWLVEYGGRGMLQIKNGKNKGVLYYLNCEACP